jgi:hypothetical protein
MNRAPALEGRLVQALLEMARTPLLGKAAWVWLVFAGIGGKAPPGLSLGVAFGLIAGGVVVSLWETRAERAAALPPEA